MRPVKQQKQYRDTCLHCGHTMDLPEDRLGVAALPCIKCRSMNKTTVLIKTKPELAL